MQQDPFKEIARSSRKSWTSQTKTDPTPKTAKREKYDFEKMKAAATHADPLVRKAAFIEYFERFNEFPSYLFDNDRTIDPVLAITMRDLSKDENASKELHEAIAALLNRLPS
jgi:hypothetical protein